MPTEGETIQFTSSEFKDFIDHVVKSVFEAFGDRWVNEVVAVALEQFAEVIRNHVSISTTSDEARQGADAMLQAVINAAKTSAQAMRMKGLSRPSTDASAGPPAEPL